ncbi:hypothetical protein AAE02nite_02220 [Adhaeribacter aerolatus]|uniref:DUF58 domain-containing protein n=1 Tax=Adhaeribacter aerolatus TaxID=670289 RepID=A0A512AS69_9BACT|nr:DUF58 domain-containing protein [Adhaeribacter aerolatus]GEO02558.1 hypothetical protein AAE02nite_02220 [Adhaeribacter aerolatus]
MGTTLLSPQTLAAIKDLSLVARMVVEGFMAGQHQSMKRGTGMEFSQYRSYQAGDDLRQLDWKMFARSDRYYIRESETDTNLRIQFVVDASNSMNHEEDGLSKLTYAKLAVACLAYLATQQSDEVMLYMLQENKLANILPEGGNRLQRLWLALEQMTATGKFASKQVVKSLLQNTRKKTITIFLSDLYEQENEITSLLGNLRSRGQEVLLLHLVGQREVALNYKGTVLFEDLETGQTIQVNATNYREQYEKQYQNWLQEIATLMRKKQITYDRFFIQEPLDKALRIFLKVRRR